MKTVLTDRAPIPAGHYVQATVHGDTIYTAGQLPIVPGEGPAEPGSIADQTRQVLANLLAVIEAAGGRRDSVLKVTVYVSDVSIWGEVNRVFAEVFGDHKPARTVVPVSDLHYGYAIEADAIAVVVQTG